jgi:hypothetical protein
LYSKFRMSIPNYNPNSTLHIPSQLGPCKLPACNWERGWERTRCISPLPGSPAQPAVGSDYSGVGWLRKGDERKERRFFFFFP